MDLDTNQAIPIEEPIDVVVEQEVVLENIPLEPAEVSDIFSCNHDNGQPVVIHVSQHNCQQTLNTVERCLDIPEAVDENVSAMVQTSSDVERDWKENSKRARDMMKKRVLRQDTEYRKKECVKAKQRMANRRNDPMYREIERQKDRERRAQARRDRGVREREREKDRSYKKKSRQVYLQQQPAGCGDSNGGGSFIDVGKNLQADKNSQWGKYAQTEQVEIQGTNSKQEVTQTVRNSGDKTEEGELNRTTENRESVWSEQCIRIGGVDVTLVNVP